MTYKMAAYSFLLLLVPFTVVYCASPPIVVNTWPFTNATAAAWQKLYHENGSSLDAVVAGCSECERQQCDGSVGYGGHPDEAGEVTLDAMIMDGITMGVGAVGSIRKVKNAIGVARAVMDHTQHTLLAGELATNFAIEMGFAEESLTTNVSKTQWIDWKQKKCQPNFRKNVTPDPTQNCGPYRPLQQKKGVNRQELSRKQLGVNLSNHDTIGMIVVDSHGNVAAGTTTNGLNHKVPGRVGDSPIMGAGSYAMNGVGGAAATGDGDIMMRFLPSFKAVMLLSLGMDPNSAAEAAIQPIKDFYPTYTGAIIVVNNKGEFGAACHGFAVFQFSVVNTTSPVGIHYKNCSN